MAHDPNQEDKSDSAGLPSFPERRPSSASLDTLVSIDCDCANVTYDREGRSLHITLYNSRVDVSDLATFQGRVEQIGGGSKISLTKTEDGHAVLEVGFYLCGALRDGMIHQKLEFDGHNWTMTKNVDRT